jgi:hypothetical protein
MDITTGHAHCHRCGRTLRSAVSCARKYGSGCWAIVRRAARFLNDRLGAFTRRQVDQAVELIEDAAVIPAALLGYFYTVSTDGTETYLTAADICSCLANKECYHQAAVLMVTA